MVELIIEESGFPKNRETLKEFQDSFKIPINELLRLLPGNRILSGFEQSYAGIGNVEYTAGVLLFAGKLWSVEAYSGSLANAAQISFFETTVNGEFNVGTQEIPVISSRPWKIVRTAKVGTHSGRNFIAGTGAFLRGRRALEFLKAGSIFTGPVVVARAQASYQVSFGENIGTKDYQVLGNFRPADPNVNFTQAFVWGINNRTKFGFDLLIDHVTANSVPLLFDYTVIPINRENGLLAQI